LTPAPDTLYETTPSWNSEPQNIEQEISNDEVWNRCAQSFFSKLIMIEYLTSIFVIRFFRVSFSIRLAAFQASGGARMKLHRFRQDNRINRISFCLAGHHPVDPVDPVRKLNRQNTLFGVGRSMLAVH